MKVKLFLFIRNLEINLPIKFQIWGGDNLEMYENFLNYIVVRQSKIKISFCLGHSAYGNVVDGLKLFPALMLAICFEKVRLTHFLVVLVMF